MGHNEQTNNNKKNDCTMTGKKKQLTMGKKHKGFGNELKVQSL